jgi:hypothetical protein
MNWSRFISILITAVGSLAMTAQEITFQATVDRQTITAGEHVRLVVSLTNSREAFTAPDMGGLVLVQGPMESSSFNYVNGRMSSSITRTWVLTATQAGTYTIGPARTRVGGGVLETDPITIEVGRATARPVDPGVAHGQRHNPDLFITLSLSKNKAWVGEQVVASYVLYSRYANIELSKYDLPKLNGFWAEDIDTGNSGWEDRPETINGLQYRVAVLKKQLLFPQRSGQLRIEPAQLTCVVNRSFFSRGTPVEISSNAVELTAMDLPGNAPADFSGAVGELQMTLQADRTDVMADEAIEITIRLSGRSNLKLLDAPTLKLPDEFEVYDPKINDRITINGNGMSGSREFQYLAIPRHEGSYDLGPFSFSYFDTRSGDYRTLTAPPLHIEVAPGLAGPSRGAARVSGRDVTLLERDIRYIRTGDLQLKERGDTLLGSPLWITGMATPALAFLLFIGWQGRRRAELADETGMRRRKADRIARKRLAEAEKALARQDQRGFHTALSKALHGYVADKFAMGQAHLDRPNIERMIQERTGDGSLAADYGGLLDTCDMARFAPIDGTPAREHYDKATELITRIERAARS